MTYPTKTTFATMAAEAPASVALPVKLLSALNLHDKDMVICTVEYFVDSGKVGQKRQRDHGEGKARQLKNHFSGGTSVFCSSLDEKGQLESHFGTAGAVIDLPDASTVASFAGDVVASLGLNLEVILSLLFRRDRLGLL